MATLVSSVKREDAVDSNGSNITTNNVNASTILVPKKTLRKRLEIGRSFGEKPKH